MVVVSNEWLVDAAEKLALLRENGVIMSAQPPPIHNTSMNSNNNNNNNNNNNSQMIRADWSQYQQQPPPAITPPTPPPPPPPQQQQNQKKLLDSQEQILTTATTNNLQIQQHLQQQNNNDNTIISNQQLQQQQIQILTPQNNKIVSKTAARAVLLCQECSYYFETRTILLEPNQEVRVGRSMNHGRPNNTNAAFECKVLSRNHAVILYSDGKFYIKDAGSSNGTFINNNRLSPAGKESRLTEVNSGDLVKFGVNVIENSRKETYGCIIAIIKLYLPDGTEAKKSDASLAYLNERNQITNVHESDLYRLNNYIQDAVQREQVLESKLQSLQKIIEITKKNSLTSWQALIDEDRLLSRIDILENKLFCCQKSLGDDKLREEILKLQEDKCLYQNSAKEALRKVYQERMEALQKLATIERAFCSSEDECSLIRDQLLQSQQHVQDVTTRMAEIEEKYDKLHEQYTNNSLVKEVQQLKQQLHLCKDNMAHANEQLSSYYSGDVRMKWFDNSELKNVKGSEAIINAICNDNDTNDDNVQLNNTKIYDKLLAIEKYLNVLEEACKEKVTVDINNALTCDSSMISSTTSSINSSIITMIGENNKTIEDCCKMEEKVDEKEEQPQHDDNNNNNNNNNSKNTDDNKNNTDNDNKMKTDDNNGNVVVHHHINGNNVNIHNDDDDDDDDNDGDGDDNNTNYNNNNRDNHQELVKNSILQVKNVINELVQYFSPENSHWNEEYQSAKEKYSVLESKLMSTALELQTLQMELQTRPTYNQYKEKIKLCEDLQDDLKSTKLHTNQLQEQIDELKLIKTKLENNLLLLSGTNNTINNNNNNSNNNNNNSNDDNNKNDNNNQNHSIDDDPIENGNAIIDKNIVNNGMDKNCINSNNNSNNNNNNNNNNISNKQIMEALINDKQTHFNLDDLIENDDLKMLNDPDVQREEELIAFKEKCAHLIDENLLLKKQMNDIKSNINNNNNNISLLQNQSYTTLFMYLAPFIAIIGYFLISPYF